MNLNFREALLTLSRALPVVLFRAGVFVAGGFMVIVFFGMLLLASRLAAGAGQAVALAVASLAVPGWWLGGRVLQRFFLYRQRAAMLLAFSGCSTAVGGLGAMGEDSKRLIPDYPRWKLLNRTLRQALFDFNRGGNAEFPAATVVQGEGSVARILDRLAAGPLGQAVMALAYARGGADSGRSLREALALNFRMGSESQLMARRWLWFSAAGLLFLFLCLAAPNWFLFMSAGAPVWVGVALAAAIAWLLYQAFIVPFALAGLSAALLADTRGRIPAPELCERLAALFPDAVPAGRQ